ncbi:MAG: SlyX family protein [Mariprofundaceae bacterium]|nr:SlyX family protein [Mariprofundaceae bacterium]
MTDIAARLTELENRFSYQEHTIQQLNEVVIAQQKQLEQQQRALDGMQQLLAQGESNIRRADEEVPPPHY